MKGMATMNKPNVWEMIMLANQTKEFKLVLVTHYKDIGKSVVDEVITMFESSNNYDFRHWEVVNIVASRKNAIVIYGYREVEE